MDGRQGGRCPGEVGGHRGSAVQSALAAKPRRGVSQRASRQVGDDLFDDRVVAMGGLGRRGTLNSPSILGDKSTQAPVRPRIQAQRGGGA